MIDGSCDIFSINPLLKKCQDCNHVAELVSSKTGKLYCRHCAPENDNPFQYLPSIVEPRIDTFGIYIHYVSFKEDLNSGIAGMLSHIIYWYSYSMTFVVLSIILMAAYNKNNVWVDYSITMGFTTMMFSMMFMIPGVGYIRTIVAICGMLSQSVHCHTVACNTITYQYYHSGSTEKQDDMLTEQQTEIKGFLDWINLRSITRAIEGLPPLIDMGGRQYPTLSEIMQRQAFRNKNLFNDEDDDGYENSDDIYDSGDENNNFIEHTTELPIYSEPSNMTDTRVDDDGDNKKPMTDSSIHTPANDDENPAADTRIIIRPDTANECVICSEAAVTTTILPCGHTILCDVCYAKYKPGDKCPICRATIGQFAKIAQ
jgi:hypothetical protein